MGLGTKMLYFKYTYTYRHFKSATGIFYAKKSYMRDSFLNLTKN